MPPLAELQRDFARALLADGDVSSAITGILSPREAMRIHRNTVFGALADALRLSFPTVNALVGENFFDQTACAFAQVHPPRTASLALYGDGFADFLAGFAPRAGLPYLADVARLDFAVEQALQNAPGVRHFTLEDTVAIALPASLTVLTLRYPAAEIRGAIADDTALAAITLDPVEHHVLVWRQGNEARMRTVRIAPGRFLQALLAGLPAQGALANAGDDPDALDQIKADIFAVPFCTIISNPKGFPQ